MSPVKKVICYRMGIKKNKNILFAIAGKTDRRVFEHTFGALK